MIILSSCDILSIIKLPHLIKDSISNSQVFLCAYFRFRKYIIHPFSLVVK
nr:MAG TPA: Ion transport protein N-terminal [Caudoviricetes sp.]